jgi:hypothetical protein
MKPAAQKAGRTARIHPIHCMNYDFNSPLKSAIRRLPIHILWYRLGLQGKVTGHCCVRSPLRDNDRHPSFSIFDDGRRYKDHGTGESGDSFDFFKAVKKLNGKEAYRPFLEVAGVTESLHRRVPR